MASSSLASPLCTWLVAACMSVPCGKDQPRSSMLNSSASASSSPKRLGRWARNRRKALLSQCCGGSNCNRNGGSISSFCGSSIQGLMTSCLAFEPCNDFYSPKNGSLFGQNGSFSSVFGSKNVPFNNNRKHRRLNRGTVHSGIFTFLFYSIGRRMLVFAAFSNLGSFLLCSLFIGFYLFNIWQRFVILYAWILISFVVWNLIGFFFHFL